MIADRIEKKAYHGIRRGVRNTFDSNCTFGFLDNEIRDVLWMKTYFTVYKETERVNIRFLRYMRDINK